MSPVLPHASFSSSRLIRFLSELQVADVSGGVGSKNGFAEELSRWLDWTDAIALSAALGPGNCPGNEPRIGVGTSKSQSTRQLAATAATDEFACARTALANSITTDDVFRVYGTGTRAPALNTTAMTADGFSPFRRAHGVHQRAMLTSIGSLRLKLRGVMADLSPALARLASLDAVMDQVLRARERQLLSTLPSLLERHFKRLAKTSLPAAADSSGRTAADPAVPPLAWRDGFCRDMQAVLLAELDVRLLPIEGMVETICHEVAGRK